MAIVGIRVGVPEAVGISTAVIQLTKCRGCTVTVTETIGARCDHAASPAVGIGLRLRLRVASAGSVQQG